MIMLNCDKATFELLHELLVCIMIPMTSNKCADEHAHTHCLLRVFAARVHRCRLKTSALKNVDPEPYDTLIAFLTEYFLEKLISKKKSVNDNLENYYPTCKELKDDFIVSFK